MELSLHSEVLEFAGFNVPGNGGGGKTVNIKNTTWLLLSGGCQQLVLLKLHTYVFGHHSYKLFLECTSDR